MTKRARKSVSLLSAALLLLLQVAPAFAVCNCDVPPGESCCNGAPEPEAEPISGCCTTAKADTSTPRFVAHGCERSVVSTDLPTVTLPTDGEGAGGSHALLAVVPHLGHPAPADAGAGLRPHLRGPPPPPEASLYLLNAALLR